MLLNTATVPYFINSVFSSFENLFSSSSKPITYILIYVARALTYATQDYLNGPGKIMDFNAISYTHLEFF